MLKSSSFFAVFSLHKGKCGDDLRGRGALARAFQDSFDAHLIFAAGTCNVSELPTKASPRAVQGFIAWVTDLMHILYVLK